MRVLVTGAAGFVGSRCVNMLVSAGHEVTATDKLSGNGLSQVDLMDFAKVNKLIGDSRIEAVVHLAAISGTTGKNEVEQSMRQPYLNFLVNTMGVTNVCEACRLHEVKKIIYLSTFAVYGKLDPDRLPIREETPVKPEHAYGVSKLLGEEVLRTYSSDFGISSTIFRAPFIVGPFQKEKNVLRELLESATKDQNLKIFGRGVHRREFIYVDDVVRAFMLALDSASYKSKSDLFILGNTPVTIEQLAKCIISKLRKGKIEFLPGKTDRTFDQFTDYSKARTNLNWTPSLDVDGIVRQIIDVEHL